MKMMELVPRKEWGFFDKSKKDKNGFLPYLSIAIEFDMINTDELDKDKNIIDLNM